MRLLRVLLAAAVLVALVSLAIPLYWIEFYRTPPLPAHARAIVVLGGDALRDGGPGPQTRQRIDRGVELWKQGAAPLLVFTGVLIDMYGRNHSREMGLRAVAEGVPASAIRNETRSRSTLQNALFTRDLLGGDPGAPIILVTSRWHLPRAWASFRFAGFTDLTLVAADETTPRFPARELAWEMAKWPVNVLRGGTALALMSLGLPQKDVTWFLR